MMINRALIIKKEHLDNIFDNGKIWEMRTTMTKIRGEIGLIESGSGLIVGTCRIFDCVDLSSYPADELQVYGNQFHRVKDARALEKWNKAWIIIDAKRFDTPRPYKHPQGAVIWVKLDVDINHGR
jgi:hypothetical protein